MHTLFNSDDLDVKIAYELAGIFSPRRPVSGKRCVEAARLIRERHPSVVALPALLAACKAAESIFIALAGAYPDIGADSRILKVRKEVHAALTAAKGE